MKTRLLIIIGIIASLAAVIATNQFASRNTSSHFNYVDTKPVTQDTYLDKTVSQWQDESFDSMMSYYDIHDDLFFEKLGALVIKNEMLNELNRQNISAVNPDFKAYPGMVLTSLPPHISFEAFVNGTDGNTYRLTGMTQLAKIDQPVHITKLQFFDTGVQLSSESILSKNNTIIIRDQDINESRVVPHNFVISGNKDIVVDFQNNNLMPIRIQGDAVG